VNKLRKVYERMWLEEFCDTNRAGDGAGQWTCRLDMEDWKVALAKPGKEGGYVAT